MKEKGRHLIYKNNALEKYLMHINQKLCGKSVFERVTDKCTAK